MTVADHRATIVGILLVAFGCTIPLSDLAAQSADPKPDDFRISDSTDVSMTVDAPGVLGVAFATSIYGYGPLPDRQLLADFEKAYRDLRDTVDARRERLLGHLSRRDDPDEYQYAFDAFRLRPENLLAFAPPADSAGLARQYYREAVDSTDYVYVHFFTVADAQSRGERSWKNVNLFLEGGGPSTHFIRFDVRRREIDRVSVNWYEQ